MNRKSALIDCSALAALLASTQFATATVQWEPSVRMGELFPSYIIATATMKPPSEPLPRHIGDWHGQIGAMVKSTDADTLVRVTVSSSKLIKPSRREAHLKDSNQSYWIYPTLEYDYDLLYATREPCPETVTVQVEVYKNAADKRPTISSRKLVVQVRSINDCPYRIRDKEKAKNVDTHWMFGAYVNENHMVVEEILQEALKTGIVNSFAGYQRDEANVVLQAFAVWNVLQRRGIKYSSITTPSSYSDKVASQHIRFIGDSLNYQQANCIDGTALFASIFRKIGIHTFLVLVPHHAFVGLYLDRTNTRPFYLETTMLGSTVKKEGSFEEGSPLARVNKAKEKDPASFNTFFAAQTAGWRKHQHYATNETDKAEMMIIDIAHCRKLGIQPLKDDYRAAAKQ